jgi:hypothetical protein
VSARCASGLSMVDDHCDQGRRTLSHPYLRRRDERHKDD